MLISTDAKPLLAAALWPQDCRLDDTESSDMI
jgi:hypothetical protein